MEITFGKFIQYTAAILITGGATVAGAGVMTQATASINFANSTATYGYNATNGPAAGVGARSFGGCATGGNFTCGVSFDGTTDTSGTLLSSFDSVTMTAHIPVDIFGRGPVDGSATGFASANATFGTVGVYATGTSNSVSGFEQGGTGAGQAGISDTLHFRVAGASANTVTLIPVSYAVNGTLSGSNPAIADVQAQLVLGSASFNEAVVYGPPSFVPVIKQQTAAGWSSYTITQLTPGSFIFNGLYSITGTSADLGVFEYLAGDGGAGGTSQYSHTGVVSINLGSNVTFTSDSGFLRQAAPAGVPEPGSLGLLASGVAALVVFGRKRRLPFAQR
ncbi:MAG: PEP-CTERM sorting domain-containing protein [Acidobacteriota bacterium]|nr:PEP-CTERM sorting domain-containing protein [Acidobacteriota bacterium]